MIATHIERFIFPNGEMADFTVVDAPTAADGLLDTAELEAINVAPMEHGGKPRPPVNAVEHTDKQLADWVRGRTAAELERLRARGFFGRLFGK